MITVDSLAFPPRTCSLLEVDRVDTFELLRDKSDSVYAEEQVLLLTFLECPPTSSGRDESEASGTFRFLFDSDPTPWPWVEELDAEDEDESFRDKGWDVNVNDEVGNEDGGGLYVRLGSVCLELHRVDIVADSAQAEYKGITSADIPVTRSNKG